MYQERLETPIQHQRVSYFRHRRYQRSWTTSSHYSFPSKRFLFPLSRVSPSIIGLKQPSARPIFPKRSQASAHAHSWAAFSSTLLQRLVFPSDTPCSLRAPSVIWPHVDLVARFSPSSNYGLIDVTTFPSRSAPFAPRAFSRLSIRSATASNRGRLCFPLCSY